MAQDDKKRTAAYVPFKTFRTALDTFEQGIPPRIDASVWQSLSGGTRSQLLTAFRFLELIDGAGNPQPNLGYLIGAKEGAERQFVLREVLEECYAPLVALADTNASSAQLSEAMNDLNVQGDTKDKAIRFYLQASEYAGLPLSAHWKKPKARGASTPRRRRGRNEVTPPEPQPATSGGDSKSVRLPESGGTVTLQVSAPITKLAGRERAFVFDLIDKMQAFEQEQPVQEEEQEEEA